MLPLMTSYLAMITVHAPQSPSPQLYLLPQMRTVAVKGLTTCSTQLVKTC